MYGKPLHRNQDVQVPDVHGAADEISQAADLKMSCIRAPIAVMTTRPKALLAWSSGKDSAWSLHVLRQQSAVEVVGLLTTINEAFDRVAMHAVRAELLRAQTAAAGLPLWPVPIP